MDTEGKKIITQEETNGEDYFVVNTNSKHCPKCHEDMLTNKKAAIYYDRGKECIKKLKKGRHVFLYQSGNGIVARGIVKSEVKKGDYPDPNRLNGKDEQYYVDLEQFSKIKPPLKAENIKTITGVKRSSVYQNACFPLNEDGKKIWDKLTTELSKTDSSR